MRCFRIRTENGSAPEEPPLHVLNYIAGQERAKGKVGSTASSGTKPFQGLRILVIHSGGDSKRVPQYSACGKLFSPVPRELPNGFGSTLV